MEFVINEWFLDWHKPGATAEEQTKVRFFTNWLLQSEHSLVILRSSNFTRKMNEYRRKFNNQMCAFHLKIFFTQVFMNSRKCRIIEDPPELPENILEKLSVGNFSSDRYLFESAETTEQKIIVTTDTRLINHFAENGRFQLLTVEEFITRFVLR